jgi:hypothetical protein
MEEQLFQKPFNAVWQAQMQAAVNDVAKLGRNQFKDPSLGGVLQGIVDKYKIDVARLEGEVTAKRRKEEKQRRDNWGDVRMVQMTWLDISIPFVGEAETLKIAPSSMTLLYDRATIGRSSVTLSVADDESADGKVANFRKHVEHNLEILRREYETAKPQLEQAVQQAATQRKAQIDAEDARDKGRSFRVTN